MDYWDELYECCTEIERHPYGSEEYCMWEEQLKKLTRTGSSSHEDPNHIGETCCEPYWYE